MSYTHSMQLPIRLLHSDSTALRQVRHGDAAYDLHAYESMTLSHGERALMPSGISLAIPDGHVGLIVPRSGLGHKHGLVMGNGVGVIDSNYRGEVFISLTVTKEEDVIIGKGDRIAQLLIIATAHPEIIIVDELPDEWGTRGDAGFDSSGRS